MGPFVPDIITDELNLVVGFFIGLAFGFVLEQAGFSSSRKLTGLFYGTDFTVLRVFFSAGVTAMCGVILLSQFGWLDTNVIFIHPLFLYAAIVGGAIMGVGFVVGGYCPGTAFCGAAIGKIDAMIFVFGGFLGVWLFGEFYPSLATLYSAASYGDLTVYALLGISPGVFALVMIIIAVSAFVAVTAIERRVNSNSATNLFNKRAHRWAAISLLALGVILAAMPERSKRLIAKASNPASQEFHPIRRMTVDEVAYRILDKDPTLQLIDVRPAEAFARTSLPGAVNLHLPEMLAKHGDDFLRSSRKTTLFFADDESQAIVAAKLAQLLGHDQVAVMSGGFSAFESTILNAQPTTEQRNTAQHDTLQFRVRAASQLTALIKARGEMKIERKPVKKATGGCGI